MFEKGPLENGPMRRRAGPGPARAAETNEQDKEGGGGGPMCPVALACRSCVCVRACVWALCAVLCCAVWWGVGCWKCARGRPGEGEEAVCDAEDDGVRGDLHAGIGRGGGERDVGVVVSFQEDVGARRALGGEGEEADDNDEGPGDLPEAGEVVDPALEVGADAVHDGPDGEDQDGYADLRAGGDRGGIWVADGQSIHDGLREPARKCGVARSVSEKVEPSAYVG